MIRSINNWKTILATIPSSGQISLRLLSDLIGYRQTSLKRADDSDQLANAVTAIVQLARENQDWMKN